MIRKTYFIFIGIVFILFFVIVFLIDNQGKNESLNLKFSGTIQNIVILNDSKGANFKIGDFWYNLDYIKDFEEINFIGCKIRKTANEQGVWIESKKGTGHFIYYDVYSGLIKDKQYINRLNNYKTNK